MDSASLRRLEPVTTRRTSLGLGFAASSPIITLGSMERKTSPRPNQEDVDGNEVDDCDADTHNAVDGDITDAQRSAVESAADALLQRLRLRARVAKPSTSRDSDGEVEADDPDNQQSSFTLASQLEPPPSPRGLPPPLSVTQLRVSSSNGQVLHASSDTVESRPTQPLLHPPPYRSPDRFLPPTPSLLSHGEWHMAFLARANERHSPGDQLELPEFADDVSSDMSSHDRVGEFLDDSVVSDGELQMPPQRRGRGSESDAFHLSDDDHMGDTYDDDEDDEEEVDDDRADDSQSELDHGHASATSLSNRDVNVSKAIALKNAMLRNLMCLAFNQDLARAALDAGVNEIEQYDSDCELAYVDIFMILVKLVCDAHHEIAPPHSPSRDREVPPRDGEDSPRVQFKWPVFDMAQFEFGNARAGTCFESVCVLINLPKVAMDRTEELMEILSSCLFCMIGDPIQVLIPSVSATGRTKGHAFLEFDDPAMARTCAAAVDGLTWGRGPYGRVRAKLFRQYQVKSPVPPQALAAIAANGEHGEVGFSNPRQPPPRRSFHQSLPPRYEDSLSAELLRHSRELSREDLNASEVSNSMSWNTDSQASLGFDENDQRRARFHLNASSSDGRQLQHSLSSLEELAFHRVRGDGTMHLGELRLSSDGEEDDVDGASSTTESDLELAEAILNRARTDPSTTGALPARARRIQSLRQSLPPLPSEPSTGMPIARFQPSASASMGDPPPASASTVSPAHFRPPPSGVDIEGPWKAYCEELIQRNREMQEQVAYARRRIAALGHNNQKLHLLIDRMERDRDGLMFENDLLQTQLHGYEDHERQQEALMKELAALRRRMKRRDQRIERGLLDSGLLGHGRGGVAVDLEGGVMSIDELEEQLVQNIVSSRRLDDLKEWEQMLEGSLVRVRSIKEEIALELQKRVAQQADDQAQDHKLCVVCLSNEKSILCLPCRHLCLCQECSQHEELDKCPICRLVVENMLLVYA